MHIDLIHREREKASRVYSTMVRHGEPIDFRLDFLLEIGCVLHRTSALCMPTAEFLACPVNLSLPFSAIVFALRVLYGDVPRSPLSAGLISRGFPLYGEAF